MESTSSSHRLTVDELLAIKETLEARERDLAFHVHQYRTFISQSSEGMWRCDAHAPIPLALGEDDQVHEILAHAEIAECNEAMARMYGFENAAEMIGTPLARFLDPADPRSAEFLRKFIRAGYRIADHESLARDADGKVRAFYSNNLVGIVKNGFLIGAWGTQRDITEQKLTREALERDVLARRDAEKASRDAAEQARLASEAKSRFLANMSHEIRTPLGIIMGFTDLALGATDPTEIRNCLEAVRRNGALLSQIIGDVLDFSKIEAQRLDVYPAVVSLAQVLGEIRSHLGFKASQKGIDLWLDAQCPLPERITTDAVRLRQILVNLIGNAIKFTNEGSVGVVISASQPLEKDKPARLRFEVRDTGIGIAKKFHKDLFQPFMQVDDSASRKFSGTGLGLMLSRQLAQALGGDLWLQESRPNHGTSFTFEVCAGVFDGAFLPEGGLPAFELSTIGDQPVTPSFQKLRILTVDDSPDNQLLIHHYLRATGALLEFAANGLEALKLVQRNDYDVILMDLQMPKLDGHETTKRLRNLGFTIPIFALTAHALHEEREKALGEGCNDYLTKPLSKATLLAALTPIADHHRAQRSAAKLSKSVSVPSHDGSDHLCP